MRKLGDAARQAIFALAAITVMLVAALLCGCDAGSPEDHSGEWFVIGSQGEPVGTARFSDADGYGFAANGLAAVEDEETGLWGFVDETGSWAVEPAFLRARKFAPNGLAAAQDAETGRWGFVDETGSWAIEPRYADAWSFYDNGTTQVQDESSLDIVWLDEEGKVVEGATAVRPWARKDDGTGLYGIAAAGGDWLCEPAFSYLQTDRHSDYLLARPQGSGLCGVVNASGAWVVGPAYADLVVAFDADPLAAKDPETGLWGYVGWDVGWVVQPAFSDATRMGDNGRALARAA